MNPLTGARYRISRSWRALAGGTSRTSGRVKDVLGGADGGLIESARGNPRVAVAWAAVAVLVLAWIGWTVYVTVENGTAAGLGVLISWPAVLAALALVSAPFIGAAVLLRRHREGPGTPAMAVGPSSSSPATSKQIESKKAPASSEQAESDAAAPAPGFISGPPVRGPG